MPVRVEFLGLPRHRTGVAMLEVRAATLGQAIAQAARLLPQLEEICFQQGRLRPGYLASINGKTFVTDPAVALAEGDTVLVLSADAGG